MNRIPLYVCLASCLAGVGACGAIPDLFRPDSVTVRLVNSGDFDVHATLFYHSEQELPEALLTEIGDEIQRLVPAGREEALHADCDDLQVIVVDDADLDVLGLGGTVGPEARSEVLRDGRDFGCGDEIVFTFAHSSAVLDFEIRSDVRP